MFLTFGSPFSRHTCSLSSLNFFTFLPPSIDRRDSILNQRSDGTNAFDSAKMARNYQEDESRRTAKSARRNSTDITGYFGNCEREHTGQPVATNRVENNNVGVAAEDNIDAGGAVVDVDEGGEEGNGAPIGDN